MQLNDGEREIVAAFAETVPAARRDAFLQSVACALSQCAPPYSRALAQRIAAEEARRFLCPSRRRRRASVMGTPESGARRHRGP
jgi:hypothetical protein